MPSPRSRVVVSAAALLLLLATPVFAQSGDGKAPPQPQQGAAAADAAKERQRLVDEYAEAERLVKGTAGQPECVWLGRRVVGLLWRDDLDTAFRHLDLYDRFGCPGGHVQATFRCLVRNGNIDPKVPEALNKRVHACWIDPQLRLEQQSANPPAPAPAAAAPAAR